MAQPIPTPSDAELSADVFSPRGQRRNTWALLGDYVLFNMAQYILNPTALPPDFVAKLGGGPILVGLAGLLWRITWLAPQLGVAAWVNRAQRKKRYVIIPSIPARLLFFPVAVLFFLSGPDNPTWLIVLMLGSVVGLAVGDGICVVSWMDVLGSSLTDARRSVMFSRAQAMSGVLVALFIAPLVRVVLGPDGPPFPQNYGVLWLVIGGLLALALLSFLQVKEGPSPPPQDAPTLREYIPFLRRVLAQDHAFRGYIVMRFIYDLAAIGMPFYIVFATTILGQSSGVALSDQILIITLTSIAAALILGRVNEKFGSRSVIMIGAVATAATPLLIFSTGAIGILGLHLAWGTQAFVNAAFVPGFLNYVVEYAPQGYRPIYSGLANTFGAMALLAPLLGGVIVQVASYDALFIVGGVLGFAALILGLRLPEPRAARQAISTPES